MTNDRGPIDDNLRNPFEHLLQRYTQDPMERAKSSTVQSFTTDSYKDGLLAKVLEKAGDAILNAAEIKQLLQGGAAFKTLHEQELINLPFEALIAAVSDQMLLNQMSTQTLGGASLFFFCAPFFAEIAINFVMKTLEPQYPQTALATAKPLETFLQTLIGLKLQSLPPEELERLIPNLKTLTPQNFLQELKNAKVQIALPTYPETNPVVIKQQLEETKAEFAALAAVAESESVNTSAIAPLMGMPEQALAIYTQAPPQAQGLVGTLVSVLLANRQVVHAAVLQQPYEELRTRRTQIKERWNRDVKEAMTEDDEKKLALVDQLLFAPPILANYYIIKQILNDLEDRIKELKGKTVPLATLLLFGACRELSQIASGRTSGEYQHVGLMHTELERLVKKIEPSLPKNPQELSAQNAANLAQALHDHFQNIKRENPSQVTIICKSHPRTLLYFLFSHSPVVEDIAIPYVAGYKEELELLLQQLQSYKGFSRYQPQVLKSLLQESKKDPASDVAKCALRVVSKALSDMIATLDPQEAKKYQDLLQLS